MNCCKDISDGEAFFAINVTCMECQKCGHLKHSDDVEYVPEFPNSQDDEFELDRDFCFKCAQIVRADNPEYDSTSDANSDDRDEGGANDLALGDAANGAGARSPFAQAAAADLVEVSPPVEVDDDDSDDRMYAYGGYTGQSATQAATVAEDALIAEHDQITQQCNAGDEAGAAARWQVLLIEAQRQGHEEVVGIIVDCLNHAIHVGELGMPYVYLSDASSDSDSSDSDSE